MSHIVMSSLAIKFLNRQQSKATQRTYQQDVIGLLKRFHWMDLTTGEFMEINSNEITDRIEEYLESFRKVDVNTGQVKNPRTINRRQYALSSFFRFLGEQISYPTNPIASIPKLRVSKWSNTPTLSIKELIIIFYHMEKLCENSESNYRDFLAILTLFHLALRLNEVTGLRWDQIDENGESITILQKGGREKTVPLPPPLEKHFMVFKERYEYIFRHPLIGV